jgi:hypothetical protein
VMCHATITLNAIEHYVIDCIFNALKKSLD